MEQPTHHHGEWCIALWGVRGRSHAQTSVLSFSDESGMGDNDLAVERTVKTLYVAGSDTPAVGQEKEARSVGGIPSQ